jgi:hypothetical protein
MMMQIDTTRHHVAISGFVADAITGDVIEGADVVMSAMPPLFATRVALFQQTFSDYDRKSGSKWKAMPERLDRTQSRNDGLFYFLDLPDGEYGLTITAPMFGGRYGSVQRNVTVARIAGGSYVANCDLSPLPPTTVRGAITSEAANVGFARVRVKSSGESTICNDAGQYFITRIEPGVRTLLVSAKGYRPAAQDVSIGKPGESQLLNFNMSPDCS